MDNPRLYGLEDVFREIHVLNFTPQESKELLEAKEQVIGWIATPIYSLWTWYVLWIGEWTYLFSTYIQVIHLKVP